LAGPIRDLLSIKSKLENEKNLNPSAMGAVSPGVKLITKEELMKTKLQLWVRGLAAITIAGGMLGMGITPARAIEANENSNEDVEVLTRGPVHEAFAETVVFDPQAGIIVPKQPPVLIEEVMPDQRPAGDNVVWIPGYWGWDEDITDFLWISGVWRNLPPGREWVPGYWSPVDTGYQWTSGYWQDAETTEVTYLPEPPRSLERGPSVKASSDDETWIPGNWEYRDDRYAWRAGYWVTAQPNWLWTPSYYRWTSYGYVYVDGYWDYPVVNRGVIFAPVRFHRPYYYERPDYYYTPVAAVALSVFANHLFLRPNYGHYYYGDYYEPGYRDRYYASYSYGSRYRGYDPIYSRYRWENRNDRNWVRERQDYYEFRRDNVDSRPPRTWEALNRRSEADRQRDDFRVVERYDRVVQRRDGNRQFQTVSRDERQRFVSQKNEIRKFSRDRQQREVTAVRERGEKPQKRTEVSRLKADRSPVIAKRSDRSEQAGGPPARLQSRASESGATDRSAATRGEKRNDKTTAGKANSRGDKAKNPAEPTRESRTKPGQRRDDVAAAKGKSQQRSAESSPRTDLRAGGKTEKATSSPASKNKADLKRAAEPMRGSSAERSQGSANSRKSAEKRSATPNVQRQQSPAPKREAAPQQEKRKKEQSAAKNQASRETAPSRKVMAEPSRKSSAAPDRQTTRKASKPRDQVKPQVNKAQPQRQQATRPESRKAQAAPQRPKAQTAARQEPQKQTVRPTPQRQAAKSAPQPPRVAPKQQTKSGSSPKSTEETDSKANKKKQRN
jgi:WXXGXW repeat (2 copies)